MYLLDTDIVIWVLRKDVTIVASLKRLVKTEKTGISTITIAEIYKHVFPSEVRNTEAFIAEQCIIPVNDNVARMAGYYWQDFHQRITLLSLPDCIIAASAKIERATLLTLNVRHFLMSDIIVRDPRHV